MPNNQNPSVAITQNIKDESLAIKEGLDLINAQDIITPNDTVILTPNFVNDKKINPAQATIVGGNSLRVIIQWVKGLNPKRFVIAAGSGSGETPDVMSQAGYDVIIREEGVEMVDLNHGPFTNLYLNHNIPNATKVNTLKDDMTKLISFTQLKQHEEATMSAACKNIALSWPPSEEHGSPKKDTGIHEELHSFIFAMCEKISSDISIVSANPAMVGSGPTKGAAKDTGLVMVGNQMIATDVVCAALLGFRPQAIAYLYKLIRKGNGVGDINDINILGIPIDEAERIFSTTVYGTPVILNAGN